MPFDLSSLTPQAQAAAIYIGYYDRAPDPFGSAFWERAVDNPALSLSDIATDFATQQETLAVHPFFSDPSPEAAEGFIGELYLNLFNRAPDAAGLEFWSGVLQNAIAGIGDITVGEIIMQIIAGAQDTAETKDLTTITNKIAVAVAWTNAAAEGGLTEASSYGDNAAAQASAKSIIEGVTDETETLETATSTIRMFEVSLKAGVAADALAAVEEAQAEADAAEEAATDADGAQAYVQAAAALKTAADQALADALASEEIAKEAKLAAAVTDATEDDAAAAAAFEVAQDAIAAAEAAIEAAEAEIESAAESVVAAQPGDNFAFTVQDDVLTGTTGVDVFRAPLYVTPEAKSVNTLGGFDAVDGDIGIDTLYASIIGDVGEPELISIENLYLQARGSLKQLIGGSPTATIDLNNADNVQQLWNDRSISDLEVNNVQNGVVVGLNDVDKGTNFYVNYASDALGGDYTQAIVLNGAGADNALVQLDIDVSGDDDIVALDISASGKNFVDLDDAAEDKVEDITIRGNGELVLSGRSNDFQSVETLDATDYTGDLTIDVSGAEGGTLKIALLGDGDDVLTVHAFDVSIANSDKSTIGNIELLNPSNDTILDGGDGQDTLVVQTDWNSFNLKDLQDAVGAFNTGSFPDDVPLFDFTNVSGFETFVFSYAGGNDAPGIYFDVVPVGDADEVLDLTETDFTSMIFDGGVELGNANDFVIKADADFDTIVVKGLVTDIHSSITEGNFVLEGFENVALTFEGDVGDSQDGIGIVADDVVSATLDVSNVDANIEYLVADNLETLDVILGSSGKLSGPVGTSSAASLEGITISGGSNSSAIYLFGGKEKAFSFIDLTDMDGATTIGYGGATPNDLLITVGEGDLTYGLDAKLNPIAEQEVFKFVGDDIGEIEIRGFETSIGNNGDRLDFSMFAGVDGIEDLDIVYTGDESTLGDTVIRADGGFTGLITVVGVDLSSEEFNFVF